MKVSFPGTNTEPAWAYEPALAWSGSGYAAVFNSGYDIYATLLNASGAITYSDIALCTATNDQASPAITWSPAAGAYVVFWEDARSGLNWELWGGYLYPSGGKTAFTSATVSGTGGSYRPTLTAGPGTLGLSWVDMRDGNSEIYFALLSANGYTKYGSDLRLTSDPAPSEYPRIVWTGAEYGVFWKDARNSGPTDVWHQRVSSLGALVGGNFQVTSGTATTRPDAAFARYGFLVSSNGATNPGQFTQAWGCNYAYNPPCPSNPVAYGVTGTTATISWLPSFDTSTDIAYYQVYRNNAAIAKTSDTFYADSGLALNATYNYAIVAVNAAQYPSSGCGASASLFVKTNATLLLTVSKSNPDAALTWSDSSGQTLPTYNVFRGTSPQVMQQVASSSTGTYSHANALMDSNLYFYTVDDPGW